MNVKNFIVVHGLTGVGKTDLLNILDEKNVDNIDLEGIAKNSGSTFGFITHDKKPPTQKKFESKIFEKGTGFILVCVTANITLNAGKKHTNNSSGSSLTALYFQ